MHIAQHTSNPLSEQSEKDDSFSSNDSICQVKTLVKRQGALKENSKFLPENSMLSLSVYNNLPLSGLNFEPSNADADFNMRSSNKSDMQINDRLSVRTSTSINDSGKMMQRHKLLEIANNLTIGNMIYILKIIY